jgi:glycosyltransferase involved in cell wall biosynthesis
MTKTNTPSYEINSIAVIGNYLPRKCGIATFTTDLVQSLSSLDFRCKALAVNDKPEGYDYPEEVRFEINQDHLTDYHTAADFLNTNEVDIVSLQHEFGIFGGASGDYILNLLTDLKMPVVTTLHTVLTAPTKKQVQVINQLNNLTDRFVVMSKNAVDILHTLYDIPREKIKYVPHGIPDMPFVDPNYYKDKFDLLGHNVLLTFGLLSENKGIEYVIKGLPKVVECFPKLTYIVLGATHPNVLKTDGEKYRRSLKQLVQRLDLEDHVIFKNDFVPFEELCEYLSATDLYITPYIQEEQITSGTLAYAAGTGKAIISTPYWYAKEMLADGRGRLVPFKNEDAIADAILELFENDEIRHQMRKRSYDFNRNTTWKEVALRYIEVFHDIKSSQNQCPQPLNASHSNQPLFKDSKLNLPQLKFDHLFMLTDNTGLLQHSSFIVANRNHGYCVDDNARALIVAIKAQHLSRVSEADSVQLHTMANRYLSFLLHAFNTETGRFRNHMSYSRKWIKESAGSEDSHGHA